LWSRRSPGKLEDPLEALEDAEIYALFLVVLSPGEEEEDEAGPSEDEN
jgi:hypothetical protein